MPSESAIALAILAGSGMLVGAVQLLPPLTAFEAPVGRSAHLSGVVIDEGAYCRANLPGVDCGCFTRKATWIMSDDNPRIAGWAYADKWALAMTQGAASCR